MVQILKRCLSSPVTESRRSIFAKCLKLVFHIHRQTPINAQYKFDNLSENWEFHFFFIDLLAFIHFVYKYPRLTFLNLLIFRTNVE